MANIKSITIRLDIDTHKKVEQLAQTHNMSINGFIGYLITTYSLQQDVKEIKTKINELSKK